MFRYKFALLCCTLSSLFYSPSHASQEGSKPTFFSRPGTRQLQRSCKTPSSSLLQKKILQLSPLPPFLNFAGTSIRIDFDDDEFSLYDENDQLLTPKNLPFAVFDSHFGFLHSVTKTDSLSGKQVLRLIKNLQADLRLPQLELSDMAVSCSCSTNIFSCQNEALCDLKIVGAYEKGKGFYEAEGAKPIHFCEWDISPEQYRLAMDFLHHDLKVSDLMDDLKSLEKTHAEAKDLLNFLQLCQNKTGLYSKDLTFSALYNKLKEDNKKSKEHHHLWHQFKDRLVSREGDFLLPFAQNCLNTPKSYCEDLLLLLSDIVVSEKSSLSYFDGNYEEWVQEFIAYLEEYAESEGLLRTIVYRNSKQSLEKTIRIMTFPPYAQLEVTAQKAQKFLSEKDYEYGLEYDEFGGLMQKLIEEYKQNKKQGQAMPIGQTYALWSLAKLVINDYTEFAFCLEK